MSKESLITNGAIIVGVGILGYLGFRAVNSLLTGGNLSLGGILGFGGGAGGTDIFGNTTVAKITRNWEEARAAVTEQEIALLEGRAKMEKYDYGPEMESAYAVYGKELTEYNDLVKEFVPTFGFWTGKEDPETKAYRARMQVEYSEALVAFNEYDRIRQLYMARNSA